MAVFKSSCGTQISHHMPCRLDDPKASIAKEVHGSVKWTKVYPRSLKLFPFLLGDLRVKDTRVELMSDSRVSIIWLEFRHTFFRGAGTKIAEGVWESNGDGTTMVKMRMASICSASKAWGKPRRPPLT